jgi:hypothetical protein
MRNLGVAAIIVGVLLIILTLGGVVGQANMRPGLAASVILIVAGWFLYKRNPSRSGRP